MTKRFVPPPNWPTPPTGWRPPAGWRPDPRWGPAPYGWTFWEDERRPRNWFARHRIATAAVVTPLGLVVGLLGVAVHGAAKGSGTVTFAEPVATGLPTATASSRTAAPSQKTFAASPSDSNRGSASERAQVEAKEAATKAAEIKAARTKEAKEKAAKKRETEAKAAKKAAAEAKAAEKRAAEKRAAKKKKRAAEARAAEKRAANERAAEEKAAEERAAEEEAADNCTEGYDPCLPPASD